MRADDIGMFWERVAPVKGASREFARSLPETPDTGWTPPKEFPNLVGARRIAFDVETKDPDLRIRGPGVRRGDGHMVGLAVGTDDGGRWYFPMRHEVETELNMDPAAVIAWAKDALAGEQDKVGANLLYDVDYLAAEGVTVGGRLLDVQIAEPLLDEHRYTYSLESLAQEHLGESKVDDVLTKWARRAYGSKHPKGDIYRCSPRIVGPYAEGDVDLPLRILEKQKVRLAEEGLTDLFALESDLLPMLLAMRRGGVRVDLVRAQAVDDELTLAVVRAQAQLDAVAGFVVNTNASASLARMFDKLGVPYPRTKPTKGSPNGKPSFVKQWLEHHPHPACALIRELRQCLKYRDTFIRGYIFGTHINGRIHTLFHSLRDGDNGTVSGRFSSSLPNLQNIPQRDEYWGPRIRSVFIPEEGCQWGRDDWSQIEYRFLAHFGTGANAREVQALYCDKPETDFHIMVSELTGLGRKPAKNVNFGLVYGMGVPLLASTLGMDIETAKREVFDVYHSRVSFVKELSDRAAGIASSRGYVKTILGRRARFPLWEPRKRTEEDVKQGVFHMPNRAAGHKRWGDSIRRAYTHKALNSVLQGSAADLMKKAMVEVWKSGVYRFMPVAHLTVHDELDHSIPRTKAAREAAQTIKRIMENAIKLRVPVLVEHEVGPSWGECK